MSQGTPGRDALGQSTELSRRYAVLIELSRRMVSILDLKRLETYIVEQAVDLLNGDGGSLMLFDQKSGLLRVEAAAGLTSERAEEAAASRHKGVAEEVAERGAPVVLIGDLQEDSRFSKAGTRNDVKAAVSAPLKIGDDVLGVLNVNIVKDGATFTEADAEFLGTLANNAAIAIKNAGLYNQLEAAYDDLKEAEEQLTTLFEEAYDAILVIDPTTRRFQRVNGPAETLTGFSRHELLHMTADELKPNVDAPSLPDAVNEAIEKGAAYVHEAQVRTRDGAATPVDIRATCIDQQGAKVVQAFVHDISLRKKLQERLRRAEKMRAVGLMTSGVAHEFNNLFAGVLGNAQLLLREIDDDRQHYLLEMIEECAVAGAETVKKMQQFTRMGVDLGFESLDIKETVDRAVRLMEASPPKGVSADTIDIEISHEAAEPLTVRGNATDLGEALRHVLTNAFEACGDSGAITVRTKRLDHSAAVVIEDNGKGISDETLERAFEPFFSTKGTTGVGLGLSLAYGILRRHRGDITIDREEGERTTVQVVIPLAAQPKRSTPRQVLRQAGGRQARILGVDDERLIREVLRQMLTKLGHEVVCAASGEEAIDLAQKQDFDLVLTDYDMPGMSGEKVAQELRAIRPHTTIALITGWDASIDKDDIDGTAIDFVLSKPFQMDKLQELIAHALGQRKSANGQTPPDP